MKAVDLRIRNVQFILALVAPMQAMAGRRNGKMGPTQCLQSSFYLALRGTAHLFRGASFLYFLEWL